MQSWTQGAAYEAYIGRWSRRLAPTFLEAIDAPRAGLALDVGCGSGALAEALRARGLDVVGVDPSAAFVAEAGRRVPGGRFEVGDAQRLPYPDASFDLVASGLVLNFVPDPARAAAEMRRVARPGATVSAYVWDYAGRMEMLRHFWDAAAEQDPARAAPLDEGRRFPLCTPGALRALFEGAGLEGVATGHVDEPTVFRDLEDYWQPFLGGQGPAPGYVAGLAAADRDALVARIRKRLPIRPDGSIALVARAWTVRGVAPSG